MTSAPPQERAFLVGVQLPGTSTLELDEQMRELAELCRTDGAEVVGSDVQRREEVEPALFIGRGKVEELRGRRQNQEFETLVCNEDLSPRQQRNLEKELDVKVVDRAEVILDIFAQHARSREGRLQVEAAQLHHWLPRLIGAYDYHRQVGGIGTRGGPGEQQIEIERRRVRKRLRDLETEIEDVRAQRDMQRAGRRRSEHATVAIVGYTNAGKSTLLNALTGAGVRAENQVFATLDPTTRRTRLPSGVEIMLTDTVGFIQKLPTDLVAAFRATLEEVTYADVVLEVLDASSPALPRHRETVDQVLTELGAAAKPRVIALNKSDLVGPATRRRALAELSELGFRQAAAVSALGRAGLEDLVRCIEAVVRREMVELELLVPYGREEVLAELREVGGIDRLEYEQAGNHVWGRAPERVLQRFDAYRSPTATTS
ncbi:MAG TPA: GTPase HflX [Candidatus Dormibacteraeota bacterium]